MPSCTSTIVVHLGDHDITVIDPGEQIHNVDSIIVHPNYNQPGNDIALLHLSTPANITSSVKPIEFDRDGLLTAPGIHATVIGWGGTQANPVPDTLSTRLRQADLDIVSNSTCNDTFIDDPISESMICAGRTNGSTNHCAGDSGGPLMVRDINNRWVVVGIVNWRVSFDINHCGVIPEVPYGVYARVSYFSSWITSYVRSYRIFLPLINDAIRESEHNSLEPGGQLLINHSLTSPDQRFRLDMQLDGNLVLYQVEGNVPVWATGTAGKDGNYVAMQSDGNLVMHKANDEPVWASGTVGGVSTLKLQDNGSIVIYRYGSVPIWYSSLAPADLSTDQSLQIDQSLISADGRFRLVMQFDGNLVLYRNEGNTPLWATGTIGQNGSYVIMQSDGNLVMYRANGEPVWASGTVGGISLLKLQDDGNLVIYREGGDAVWATNTAPVGNALKNRDIIDGYLWLDGQANDGTAGLVSSTEFPYTGTSWLTMLQ